jgi:hypothetical protein
VKNHLADCEMELKRFTRWVGHQDDDEFSLLFVPRGEALMFPWYQQQLVALSHYENIHNITCQTNLSYDPGWLDNADKNTLVLWITYHPFKTSVSDFLKKCSYLLTHNINFSVGVVGITEFIDTIKVLREKLPERIYVWVNAYKDKANYYTDNLIKAFTHIDPYFEINLYNYDNYNKSCAAGEISFFISANGDVQRCYQDRKILGNIYKNELNEMRTSRPCSMEMCTCFIGYINIPRLDLGRIYGDNVISRIPLE